MNFRRAVSIVVLEGAACFRCSRSASWISHDGKVRLGVRCGMFSRLLDSTRVGTGGRCSIFSCFDQRFFKRPLGYP